jgi:hypothetical protein
MSAPPALAFLRRYLRSPHGHELPGPALRDAECLELGDPGRFREHAKGAMADELTE